MPIEMKHVEWFSSSSIKTDELEIKTQERIHHQRFFLLQSEIKKIILIARKSCLCWQAERCR